MSFRVLCADPPWSFGDKLPGGRGARAHYSTMTVEEICAFGLPPLADDAWLFLWRVSSQVEEAYRVVRAWGFTPKSEIVWEKLDPRTGGPWMGMGHYVRGAHETAIVAVRGRVRPDARDVRSRFAASIPTDAAGKLIHSAKPEVFYRIVQRLAAGPYVELFARHSRPDWTCLGNELPQPSGETAGAGLAVEAPQALAPSSPVDDPCEGEAATASQGDQHDCRRAGIGLPGTVAQERRRCTVTTLGPDGEVITP